MPMMQQGDLEVAYEVVGEGRPWVITPGGRFSKDYGGVRELAHALAGLGNKVLIYDRLNCGASAVHFAGPSESVLQADSLAELLRQLDFGPTVIAGGSGGARISLLTAARHPDVASGVAIWWTSGGVFGNMSLGPHYCGGSIVAAWNGTMADVAALPEWAEVIERNPRNRDRFLAMERARFLVTLQDWMHAYCACGDPLVPGLTDEEAAAMGVPTLVFRSGESDIHHTRATSERLAAELPNARLVEPPWGDREWLERQDAMAAGEALFARWQLLAPQLHAGADEVGIDQ
ncbi:MAG TPA: alpha/beta hydrolase [Acidimicrobiales bacterium]|nr:alpha/beta hydrolase [Acidimicrobiales bacterium]